MKNKKIVVSIIIVVLIFFSFTNVVQANLFTKEEDYSEIEDTIEKDEGGLFEKVIARMIRRNSRNGI